jgi:hypothetical protein
MPNYNRIKQELINKRIEERYDGVDMLTSRLTNGDIAIKCNDIDNKCNHPNGCCILSLQEFQEWNCKCAYQNKYYFR